MQRLSMANLAILVAATVMTLAGVLAPTPVLAAPGLEAHGQFRSPGPAEIETLSRRLAEARGSRVTRLLLLESPVLTTQGIADRGALASPPDTSGTFIPWRQVDRIEKRVSRAGTGAWVGAIVGGGSLAALFGAASTQIGLIPSYEVDPGAVVGGFFVGAVAGAALGALVAAPGRAWGSVYRGASSETPEPDSPLARRLEARSARVISEFVSATGPRVIDEGIEVSTPSDELMIHWRDIDRVEVRGARHAGAAIAGAALGTAAVWVTESLIHFEPRDAQYLLIGGSSAGAAIGWLWSGRHGDWRQVHRGNELR
jgi:hypothetical protein